jgi:decaprenylphospho-beta-D-erythro-pentofuranosid-2-ulose 2-reductase
MRIAILGATKGMGRAIARLLADRKDTLFLLGREPEDLERSAADLQVRGDLDEVPGHARCDLEEPATFEPALAAAVERLGVLDAVVVTAGIFATQDELEGDPARLARLLTVNFTNTVLFCEAARRHLLDGLAVGGAGAGAGKLVVFSSVAGDRGRKPVVLYGAAKAGLSAYLEGLDHRFHDRGLVTVCVKPGFVKTSMTQGLKPPPFAGEAQEVAARVVRALDRGAPVVYAPAIWRLVMAVIRRLPRFVMRKVGF